MVVIESNRAELRSEWMTNTLGRSMNTLTRNSAVTLSIELSVKMTCWRVLLEEGGNRISGFGVVHSAHHCHINQLKIIVFCQESQ